MYFIENVGRQLRGLVVRAFACEADRLSLILSWVMPKT